MLEVTKEQFYKEIFDKNLDVVVNVIGNFPYTSLFEFRNRTVWGKVVDSYHDGKHYPIITKFYICNK